MPYLKIQINHTLNTEISKNLLVLTSTKLARELGKPERYVMVELATNPAMIFGGTADPAAYPELKSIGLTAEQVKSLSQSLPLLLEETLGVPTSRTYIEFTDAKGSFWGWNGSTF